MSGCGLGKGDCFVVGVTLLEAVEQHAHEAVEEVPLCGDVTFSGRSTAVVVCSGAGRPGERDERPDVADGGQSLVLDLPAHDLAALAARSGDRGASRVGLQ